MTNLDTASLRVNRCEPKHIPKASNIFAARGLAYERKLFKELQRLAIEIGADVEHNPWYEYEDDTGALGRAVPDIVFSLGYCIIVIEAKLTFVPEALEKLSKIYVPIIRAGTTAMPRNVVKPLVVAKTLTPEVPLRISRLVDAFSAPSTPVLQWMGHGRILW